DLQEAMLLGTRIALMDNGKIVFLGTPAEFSSSTLRLARDYMETIAG
nr:ABC transporter ATP-binding protein [Blastocatellia bacterium]